MSCHKLSDSSTLIISVPLLYVINIGLEEVSLFFISAPTFNCTPLSLALLKHIGRGRIIILKFDNVMFFKCLCVIIRCITNLHHILNDSVCSAHADPKNAGIRLSEKETHIKFNYYKNNQLYSKSTKNETVRRLAP